MRNLRRAVLGGWFIQVIPCNHSQMWGFHDGDSDRDPISEHVRLLQVCLEKESSRRNSFWNIGISIREKFWRAVLGRLIHSGGWFSSLSNVRFSWSMILTGPLLLSMSGYFRDVWRKKLLGETVFGNIVISFMRNFRIAVLGGLFIQVVACNHRSNVRFSWWWFWQVLYFWSCQATSGMSGQRTYPAKQFFESS